MMNPYLVISSCKDKADGELYETWVRIFSDINNTFEIDQDKFNYLKSSILARISRLNYLNEESEEYDWLTDDFEL